MSKYRIRQYGDVDARTGRRPELARHDVPPYPSRGYRNNPQGIRSLFLQGEHRQEEDDYRRKHGWMGGDSVTGVRSIKLLDDAGNGIPQGVLNIDGWDMIASNEGNLRILDSVYFGKALTAWEQRMERLKHLAKICQMSDAIMIEAMGNNFFS